MDKDLAERLGELRDELDRIDKRTETLPRFVQAVRDHHRDLYGHGGHPGMKIVVDRLDQWMKSEKRLRAMLIGAIISAAVGTVFSVVSGVVMLTR